MLVKLYKNGDELKVQRPRLVATMILKFLFATAWVCNDSDIREWLLTLMLVEWKYAKMESAWSTVCDDSWDDNGAQVVCRQLGYPTTGIKLHDNGVQETIIHLYLFWFSSGAVAWTDACYGEGNGYFYLDEVECNGNKSTLLSCPHSGISHDVLHSKDAGVFFPGRLCYDSVVMMGLIALQ